LEKFNELLELLGCDPRKEEPQEVIEEPQEAEAPTEPENEPSPTILILAEGKLYTANEGPVRIHYKCLLLIYVFPEMKRCSLFISKAGL
jgi:hypothetical protein